MKLPPIERSPLLYELLHQFLRARGRRKQAAQTPFRRDWETLLRDAKIHTAEGAAEAALDANAYGNGGYLELIWRDGRVRGIHIPLAAEPRWFELAGGNSPEVRIEQAIRLLESYSRKRPPHRLPHQWPDWCTERIARLRAGRTIKPLDWHDTHELERDLRLLYALLNSRWEQPLLIRDASTKLGFDSKHLERRENRVARLLADIAGEEIPLESLGIIGQPEVLLLQGPLILRFPEGAISYEGLEGVYGISERDLCRAIRAATVSDRILTVENTKTTFHQIAAANLSKQTLVIAGGRPTRGFLRLIALLPQELQIHHFGDTDPAGFAILQTLRAAVAPRSVLPFQMALRSLGTGEALAAGDRAMLERMLQDAAMADLHPALEALLQSGHKGDFEQETLGAPDLEEWPFYSRHIPAVY